MPTPTPAPPTATATLVIQDTPVITNAPGISATPATNTQRYPAAVGESIGFWLETTHLTPELLRGLAPYVQLVSGPQAATARQINPRVVTLAHLDLAPPDTLVSRAQTLSASYDSLLLESANMNPTPGTLFPELRQALPRRLLIADTQVLTYINTTALARVDGICLCSFLRAADAPLDKFKSEADWKQDVDALAARSAISNTLVLVATRFDKVSNDALGRLPAWFDYALTSYLLSANGTRVYFSFQGAHADDLMTRTVTIAPLGYAIGAYYQAYGLYARPFQKGLVVVNPGVDVRELPLTRAYLSPNGQAITWVRLEPHTGIILQVVP